MITSLLLAEHAHNGAVRLGAFWARRARRLLPALFGMLAGVAAYAAIFASPEQLTEIRGDALATLGYVANWREISTGTDYWALFRAPSPLQHTWSLAIEEQFYLLWPLAVFLIAPGRRNSSIRVLVTSLALAVGSLATMLVYESGDSLRRAYFGTETRVASILLGAALAAWLSWRGPVRDRLSRVALELVALAGAVVLGLAWTQVDGTSHWLYRGGLFICALASVAVIAAVAHPRVGPIARIMSVPPLRWLGTVSYGVYLWHWPLYVVLSPQRTNLDGITLTCLRVGATLAIAGVSFRFLELPIRTGVYNVRRLAFATPAVVVALTIAVFVGTVGATSTASVTKPPEVEVANRARERAAPGTDRVMFVGNSVGYFLGLAAKEVAPDRAITTFNGAFQACVFPRDVEEIRFPSGDLLEWKIIPCDRNWKGQAEAFDPNLVVMAWNPIIIEEVRIGNDWLHPCMPAYDAHFRDALERLIDEVGRGRATVAFALMPEPLLILGDVGEARNRADCVNQIYRDVAEEEPNAVVVDLANYVCPDHECRNDIDGATLRADGVHFQDAGARLIVEWILDEAELAE